MFYILLMVCGTQILGLFTLFFSFYYVFGGSGGQRAGISFQMSIIRKTDSSGAQKHQRETECLNPLGLCLRAT